MCSDEEYWIHIRRLPTNEKKYQDLKSQITNMCNKFDNNVVNVIILHGRGQALVKFKDTATPKTILNWSSYNEFINHDWPHPAVLGPRKLKSLDAKDRRATEEYVRTEVDRALQCLIRNVINLDSKRRMECRQDLRNRHKKFLRNLESNRVEPVLGDGDTGLCWEYVASGGKCVSDRCFRIHKMTSILSLPVEYRVFETEDFFPLAREISPMKMKVNDFILHMSSSKLNKRCLVLDGARCNTVKTLLSCTVSKRTAEHIVVPNYCTATYTAIKDSALCQAYFGSLRAYLDETYLQEGSRQQLLNSDSERQFGLVYLDYCCRLTAGYRRVEKSPVADLECLFKYQVFDEADGTLLTVCLCVDADEVIETVKDLSEENMSKDNNSMTVIQNSSYICPSQKALFELITKLSETCGYSTEVLTTRFTYGKVFVESFLVKKIRQGTSGLETTA